MSLDPLLAAPPVWAAHAFAAIAAFGLGLWQLLGPKGTLRHVTLGWVWALLMAAVAITSFWIHGIRQVGPFSWIHGLSIYVLITLPLGLRAARRGDVRRHGITMAALFFGALVIAGGFTLVPGRLMREVVFG